MRISVFYHESIDQLSDDKRDIVKLRLVPEAVEYWENILTVVNPTKNIKLNRKCQDNQYFLSPGDTTQYCKVSLNNVTIKIQVQAPSGKSKVY